MRQLLLNMARDGPAPVVIVQHIAPGFLAGMIDGLARSMGHGISPAGDGELAWPGRIYFVPEGRHLEMDGAGRVILPASAPEYGVKPAVARFFRSVAAVDGAHAAGILLTGMGSDGAAESPKTA